jgi:hypothetical protein
VLSPFLQLKCWAREISTVREFSIYCAIDQKGILSRGRSPIALNFGMVYKKINTRLIRLQVGTVGVSKEA